MRLFLAADAKHPESIEKLKSFIGPEFPRKKIVYVPTASNGEHYGKWKSGESIQAVVSLGNSLSIVELEDQCYKDVISEIRTADILWLAGGMTAYLLYWLRRTELDKAIPELLAQGIPYIGSSASSMACSKTVHVAEVFIGESEPGASLVPGLGLIDFEIYPHYEDELRPEIEKRWQKGTLYLLKNGEVITVENGKVTVLGEERIIRK